MGEAPAGERGIKRFFRELRRRHVFESAGLYVAGAWVLIEVADILFPIFNVPDGALRVLVVVGFVAFPIVVGLAWKFDVSLRGLVRTPDLPAGARDFDFDSIDRRSIAVLPFVNSSGDADSEFFGDGLSEELLNLLAKLPGLKVAARTSSFAFKGRDVDIREIGSLLGVWHVLEGSVRRAGRRVRITAQLVEAPNGFHLWSETFDRNIDDIFAVEDEISAAIVEALHLALSGKAGRKRAADELPTDNIEAHQFVLRANYLWQRRGAQAIQGAISALEQAVDLDHHYSDAYARLAAAEATLHEYTFEPREPGFARAEAYARKAIALDPSLGEPHGVLGYMALRLWRWQESERHLQKAIELEPNHPTLHQWHSNLLNDFGRHDDALAAAKAAHALDPLSPTANNVLAFTALFQRDDETAARHAAIAREYGLGGGVPDYVDFIVHLRSGDFERAADEWAAALAKGKARPEWVTPVVAALKSDDARETALDVLTDAEHDGKINERMLFFHYCLLGDPQAFDIADSMMAEHAVSHVWMFLPEAEALARHPRFQKFMDGIGVLEYWRRNGFPARYKHLG